MKTAIGFLGILLWLAAASAQGQGRILIQNPNAQTRLWSIDGPIAGPGIWGQMFAGPTPESLAPIGLPVEHFATGYILGGVVEVPTVSCDTWGFAQMAAWDGTLWGTMLEGVPLDQLGYTDVASVPMTCFPGPVAAPHFNQPAIVPVPEPSVLALAGLGLSFLFGLAAQGRLDYSRGRHRSVEG